MEISAKQYATVFKALGDENRITILKILSNGEQCACSLLDELNISQPTLSHHMKILCDTGVVNYKKVSVWAHYSISEEGISMLSEFLNNLT